MSRLWMASVDRTTTKRTDRLIRCPLCEAIVALVEPGSPQTGDTIRCASCKGSFEYTEEFEEKATK